jgi:hypothetical protein
VAPVLSLSCHFRCVFILLGVFLQGAGFAAEGSGAALPDPRGDNEHPQPACAGADRAIRKPTSRAPLLTDFLMLVPSLSWEIVQRSVFMQNTETKRSF